MKHQEYMDIHIPVPWGQVVGRWYGSRKVRPILALHGWLDNLGTWNNLLPLLPSHVGVLCIDLPGHGRSDHLPKGICYHSFDFILVIMRIIKEYNWKKVSVISHSMSSSFMFVFTALYPHMVDMLITIDIVRTRYMTPAVEIADLRSYIDKFLTENERVSRGKDNIPPMYSQQEITQLQHTGSSYSVSIENCHHIFERNVTKSTMYPEKYFFSRDARVKYFLEFLTTDDLAADFARQIHNIPICAIKALDSPFMDEQSNEVIAIFRENNPHFELHELKGTHHIHLNNAAEVAAVINPFINKHRPPLLESWSIDAGQNENNKSKL